MNADDFLCIAASALLRVCSPTTAHRVLVTLGRVLPRRHSIEAVRDAASRVRRGTCLTRSLALAARSEGADVVIGVRPETGGTIHAHAWIEFDGEPLHPTDPSGAEIARLRGRRARASRGTRWAQSPRP